MGSSRYEALEGEHEEDREGGKTTTITTSESEGSILFLYMWENTNERKEKGNALGVTSRQEILSSLDTYTHRIRITKIYSWTMQS